jgi:hypothetical protein
MFSNKGAFNARGHKNDVLPENKMPKLKKADYACELCRYRRLLGLTTTDDHYDLFTVPKMASLLKRFKGKNYTWIKRDYIDWIIGVRLTHHLPANRLVWNSMTVKALKAEKDRIETGIREIDEEVRKRKAA